MSEITFPQFSRLPCELRLKVWTEYALPPGPMIHSISYNGSWPHGNNILLCSFGLGSPYWNRYNKYSQVNVHYLSTTRSLMQVNYEARKTVLGGRQLQRVVDSNHFNVNTFHGGSSLGIHPDGHVNVTDSRRPHGMIYHKFFFVNWDIDMFYFRSGIQSVMHMILDESCLQKMQRMAVEIRGPRARNEGLYALWYTDLFDMQRTSRVPVVPAAPVSLTRRLLASVNKIFLVLGYKAARKIYKQNLAEQDDREPDTVLDEVLYIGETDSEAGSVDESDYDAWCDDLPPRDEFGFHHIEAEPGYYFETPLTRLDQLGLISFQDWAAGTVHEAERDARENYCGRPVDVHMVMDLDGHFDGWIMSYYRNRYFQFGVSGEPIGTMWRF
ncbi:hypothetical protein F4680DRAFT_453359 [Xylaria scruposa]|nr:hypothetical protein F4680DRAFT_453359 [Xylaria scruposa]